MSRMARSIHFWVILAILALLAVLHYADLLGIAGASSSGAPFGLTRHAIDRILFLLPMIYAAFVFRLGAGLVVCLITLAIMLPRALLVSPSPGDALLESFSAVVIGALACFWLNARLMRKEERQQATAELETIQQDLQAHIRLARSNEKRLATINAMSGMLSQSLELGFVLRNALDMVMEVMEVEVATIFSLDDTTQELRLMAADGVSDQFGEYMDHIKVGEGFNGQVALTGQPLIVENASYDPRLTREYVREEKIEAACFVPLKARGFVVGTLSVGNRRPRYFLPEEVELLTAIGSQIGITMENAQLYQQQQRIAKQYRDIFDNASDAIWVHNLEGDILTANEAAAVMTGYSTTELSRMNVTDFLSEHALYVARDVRRRLLERKPVEQPYEQRLLRKDGTEAILKLSTALVIQDGRPTGFQHIARDVTEEKRAEEVLKESERELSQIVDGSSVPIFVINNEHTVTHWNKACESLTGVSTEEVVGTKRQWKAFYHEERPVMADLIVDKVPEEDIARFYHGKYRSSTLIQEAYEAEDFFPHLGEGGKWLFFTAAPLRDQEGQVFGAIETLQDMTGRKRVEQALTESEGRYRDLFDSASEAIVIIDLEGNIVEVNRAASDLTGYTIGELTSMSLPRLLTADSLELATERQRSLLDNVATSERYELRIYRKDGSQAIVELATRAISHKGHPVALYNIARDVTEERRMQDNLRFYLQEITRAQEEERKRIARELHDDTAQRLIAVSHLLENFASASDNLSQQETDLLEGVREQVKNALQGVRHFSRDLRPPMLDDLGLLPSLEWLTDDLQRQFGIEAELKVVGEERRFTPEAELLFFRVIQEAVSNVRRHARASRVEITIEYNETKTRGSVKDNGKGFQLPEALGELSRDGKLGLLGMEERARLLGGTLSVESWPGEGTSVTIEAPV